MTRESAKPKSPAKRPRQPRSPKRLVAAKRSAASPPAARPRGEATRQALLEAAVGVFARDGYHAVSTRTLASAAGVNQALIGYHFGGKMGLYLAVFDDIAGQLLERIGPLVDALEAHLESAPATATAAQRRAHFLPPLLAIAEGMLELMLSDETEEWSQLILREQQHPGPAFERLYATYMGRVFGLLARLVQELRGDGDLVNARTVVVGIVGSVLVWRAARATVMRHLGWGTPGANEVAAARAAVRRSVEAQALAGVAR
jgi:AcrR family transcriptional regulator